MNFPTVNEALCPDELPGNGDPLGDVESLILKPDSVTACAGELQFSTYLKTDNGGETLVEIGLTYASLNPAICSIDASTGLATLIAAGITTITVTNGTLTAASQVEVMGTGTNCCDEVAVATLILIDNSKSMKSAMTHYPGTRLNFAKHTAVGFVSGMRLDKDYVGLMKFNLGATEVQAISHSTLSNPTVFGIPQTKMATDLYEALVTGIATLGAFTADRHVLVIISDGEHRPGEADIEDWEDIVDAADNFKASGGIIMCIGASAAGDGFALLQAIASGGFFLNTSDLTTTNAIQERMTGLMCYYCGGYPPSYGYCLAEPLAAQVPITPALEQTEL